MATARIVSIQVGKPAKHTDEKGEWESGYVKLPIEGPVMVRKLNIDGDGQADPRAHGGPDQAAMVYSANHYPDWRVELNRPDLPYGAFAENLTVDGIDETTVCLGDSYRIGDVVIQVTQPRGPCWKIARRHGIPTLTKLVLDSARTGWHNRVLAEGMISPGDPFELIERPHPEWTVHRALKTMYVLNDIEALGQLVVLPELGHRWRDGIIRRVQSATAAD